MVDMIATGEVEDTTKQRSGRVKSEQAGAKARSDLLTKERRSEIAKKAAKERWK